MNVSLSNRIHFIIILILTSVNLNAYAIDSKSNSESQNTKYVIKMHVQSMETVDSLKSYFPNLERIFELGYGTFEINERQFQHAKRFLTSIGVEISTKANEQEPEFFDTESIDEILRADPALIPEYRGPVPSPNQNCTGVYDQAVQGDRTVYLDGDVAANHEDHYYFSSICIGIGAWGFDAWGTAIWSHHIPDFTWPNFCDITWKFRGRSHDTFIDEKNIEIYLRDFRGWYTDPWGWVLMGWVPVDRAQDDVEWNIGIPGGYNRAAFIDDDGRTDIIISSDEHYEVDYTRVYVAYEICPETPRNVVASDNRCDGCVNINWDDMSNNEDGFYVYRNGTIISTRPENSEQYQDCPPPGTYTYCVSAYNTSCESEWDCDNGTATTLPISPNQVSAWDGTHCERVRINWNDRSDNEDGFRVYRNGFKVCETNPNVEYCYDDAGEPGTQYNYCVRAFNNCDESSEDCDPGWKKRKPDTPTNCQASDGTYDDRVEVTWNTVSDAIEYYIYRDGDYKGSAMTPPYRDYDVECGIRYYNYEVTARNICGESGYSNEDQGCVCGGISGYVRAQTCSGAGVPGVMVHAVGPNDQGNDITNEVGYFEITGLKTDVYTVTPEKTGHQFNPPSRLVNVTGCELATIPECFRDQTQFNVGGQVRFQAAVDCGAPNVNISIDGIKKDETDANGDWNASAIIGPHTFEGHDDYNWDYVENPITRNIDDNTLDIDFTVTTTRTLTIDLVAGCGSGFGPATITVLAKSSCFAESYQTDLLGDLTVVLPPMEYYVNYTYKGYSPDNPVEVDLRQADQEITFKHYSPLHIRVENLPKSDRCVDYPNAVLHRGQDHSILISAYELIDEEECPVDAAAFRILDLVSDNPDWQEFILADGEYTLTYNMRGGEPNISPDYLKKLEIHVTKPGYEDQPNEAQEIWFLNTGDKIIGDYLTSVSPDIVFWIVHDPHGDRSYSYVLAEHSFLTGSRLFLETEAGFGYDFHAFIPVGGPIGVNIKGKVDLTVGVGLLGELLFNIAVSDQFTTSNEENPSLTGPPGDLYVVAALNIKYGSSKRVSLDENCGVTVTSEISYYPDSFETTDILTGYYIENHVIPECPDQNCKDAWSSILQSNVIYDDSLSNDELNDAEFIGNYSVSGGGSSWHQIIISSITETREFSGWIELEEELAAGVGIIGDPVGVNLNVHASIKIGAVSSESETETTEIGIHLEDNDQDDHFSLDVYKDLTFGTYLSVMKQGSRSSCPWEDNTSQIQFVTTQITNGQVHQDRSVGQVAQWTLRVANPETMEYAVPYDFSIEKVVTTCNSTLKIDGNDLGDGYNHPVPLENGQYIDFSLTAEYGPNNTCECDTLTFRARPTCEHRLFDEVTVSVCWESGCVIPTIVLVDPGVLDRDNCSEGCTVYFYVNTQDDYLDVESIVLERRLGQLWIPEDTIRSPIPAPNPNWTLNCEFDEHYTDGDHQFRIVFNCANGSKGYSEYVVVTADRGVDVVIAGFEARFSHGKVELSWDTRSAVGLQGFNIYRSVEEGIGFQRINEDLISAEFGNEWTDRNVRVGKMYSYRLGVVDEHSEWFSETISIRIPGTSLALHQNYPNPFNPSTTISYTLPQRTKVNFSVFSIEGKLLKTLVDETLPEGFKEVTWDGKDAAGNTVSSGVYFYRLKAGKKVLTRKMVVIK